MVILIGFGNIGEWAFLLIILLLLFGGKKLPELARGLGAGIHEFKRGMNAGTETSQEHRPIEQTEPVERDITPEERARQQALPAPKAPPRRRAKTVAKKKSPVKSTTKKKK